MRKIFRRIAGCSSCLKEQRFRVDGTCCLAERVNIAEGAQVTRGTTIGTRTSIGRDAKVQDADIGKYCSVSWNVTIGALSHPTDRMSTHAFVYQKRFGIAEEDAPVPRGNSRCSIGNDVWIGCHAVILSGVRIGDGAIVGAGSVVTHDVPPYAVVVGVPARLLKMRFPESQIAVLIRLRWWDFPDALLRKAVGAGLFSQTLTDGVLDRCEEMQRQYRSQEAKVQ